MQKITIILNGRLRKKNRLKQKLNQRLLDQFTIDYCETKSSGDAIQLAQGAIEGTTSPPPGPLPKGGGNLVRELSPPFGGGVGGGATDYLVAIGGDGMLNEVINGYMNSDEALRENVTVGLLPYGTGNDFSKTIGMRNDIEQLAGLIENDQTQPVDIGEVQYKSHEGVTKTRYYINITDIGIGGLVVKTVNQSSKFLGPDLTYKKAILQAFFTYKHAKVRLTSDSFQWEGPILCLCMANGRYFGSGMCIAPQADVSNGKIQLVIFGNVSLMDYLKNMSKIKKGEILEHPEIHYEQIPFLPH